MATKKIKIIDSLIQTDETLTQSGVAADAKVVGDTVAAETDRAEMAETSLQNQINTIINNPLTYVQDTEPTNVPMGTIWFDTSVTSVKGSEGVEF